MVNPDTAVFLFIGSERYLKENALNKLKASLRASPSEELDYKVFYGSDATAREILEHATAFPLFSSKKLIAVKEFDNLPKEDRARLAEYLKNPAKSTYLVIDAEKDDDVKEIAAAVRDARVMRFSTLADGELSSWITKYLAERGKSVETGAVEMLKELQGSNLVALTQELEKLASFIGASGCVTASDVETLVGKSAVESAFELGWAIGDKDVARAMKVVSRLMLFASRETVTSPESSPRASACRSRAQRSPMAARRRSGGQAATSPMVWKPSDSSRSALLGPTPQMRLNGRGARVSASLPGGITVRPSGFSRSLASLARNLFGATPTLAVSPVSLLMRSLMSRAILSGGPNSAVEAVTSRKASSTETCSRRGV